MPDCTDRPILRMMLGVVQSHIRTSVERFGGSGPDSTTFPASVKKALEEEVGELPQKLALLGVRIEWREDR